MHSEIVDIPFHVTLIGLRGVIDHRGVPATGLPLMDALWREVRRLGIKTSGINHWVYLPDDGIFTGVEPVDPRTNNIGSLERKNVSLTRHLRHLHRGPYSTLPEVWPMLFDFAKQQGLKPIGPHLEIYGHHCEDPETIETTILIGLAARS
jgi:hypothetical protein